MKARRSLAESSVASSERIASAVEAFRALDRAAAKGVLHANNAARRKSRLAKKLARLAVVSPAAPAAPAAQAKGGRKKN